MEIDYYAEWTIIIVPTLENSESDDSAHIRHTYTHTHTLYAAVYDLQHCPNIYESNEGEVMSDWGYRLIEIDEEINIVAGLHLIEFRFGDSAQLDCVATLVAAPRRVQNMQWQRCVRFLNTACAKNSPISETTNSENKKKFG